MTAENPISTQAGRILLLAVFTLTIILHSNTSQAFAGASAGGGPACRAATLSNYTPEKLSIVQHGDTFTFDINQAAKESITVTLKNQTAEISISELAPNRHRVTGAIPDTVPNGYAKILVDSRSSGGCKAADGWLVIVGSADIQCAASSVSQLAPAKLAKLKLGSKFSFEINQALRQSIKVHVNKAPADFLLDKLGHNRHRITVKLGRNHAPGFAKVGVLSKSAAGCPEDTVNWLYKFVE